ncbi:hypothetical protein IFR05_012555 [Cadophora sp. M221]|nr:hypothetical protein IFR05_012555 [Cadophora sp. M221]
MSLTSYRTFEMTRLSILALVFASLAPFVIAHTATSEPDSIVYPSTCVDDNLPREPQVVYIDVMDESSYTIYHVCTTAGTRCQSTRDCFVVAEYSNLCPPDHDSGSVPKEYLFCDPVDNICKAGPQVFPGSPCGCSIGCLERTEFSNYREMGCVHGNCTVLEDVGRQGL